MVPAVRPTRIDETSPTRNDAPEIFRDALTAALTAGVPALLDDVREMLRPVAPEYAEFLVERGGEVVVVAEAAMAALVEHAEQCLIPVDAPDSASLPDDVVSLFGEVGRTSGRTAMRSARSCPPTRWVGGWRGTISRPPHWNAGSPPRRWLPWPKPCSSSWTSGVRRPPTAMCRHRRNLRPNVSTVATSSWICCSLIAPTAPHYRRWRTRRGGRCRSGRPSSSSSRTTRPPGRSSPDWDRTACRCATVDDRG